MNRYRKKVIIDQKTKQNVIVIDCETDQPQQPISVSKKIINKGLSCSSIILNNYQKIEHLPQYRPSLEEMKGDSVKLTLKLQQKYKQYGAVKIIPPSQWQPSFNFKYTQKGITTRIQKIHRLRQGKAFEQKIQFYNIKSFTGFAENYERNYKFKFDKIGSTLEAQMENQYWQIVKGPQSNDLKEQFKYKETIQYAADLPVNKYGSGFPLFQSPKTVDNNFNYATSYFNLNNIYKAPSSTLKITDKNNEKISGITIPWVYMGMQFSSFCWHVEDLWINSINYSHKGATKTWYVIPESDKSKFDNYVLKTTGKRQFLNSITYMIDPLQLIKHGIKVYKAYQRPREYILTLFNAYHAGFSQGFNVGQAVNVGSVESFNVIKQAQTFNAMSKKNHKPPVICYEWLIASNLGNSNINQQLVTAEYSKLVALENQKLKKIIQKNEVRSIQFIDSHTKYDRFSCQTCKYYQYLSLVKCVECQKKYCLGHTDKCCGKGFIFVTRESDKYRKKNIEYVSHNLK